MTIELISVHVPKSGGSSFREALQRAYTPERIFFDYADRPLDPVSPMNVDPDGFLASREAAHRGDCLNKRAIHGHFWIKKYDHMPRTCFRTAFLRHPVDRLISHYYFWLGWPRRGHNLQNYILDNRLTLLQCARLPALRYFYTQYFFRDVDLACFDFIGFSETLNADGETLSRLLGTPLAIGRINTNAHQGYDAARRELSEDARTMGLLRDLLADDIRFYEAARARA